MQAGPAASHTRHRQHVARGVTGVVLQPLQVSMHLCDRAAGTETFVVKFLVAEFRMGAGTSCAYSQRVLDCW